ncbi:diguanylate cyclase (GGDEF)-like protein/PAS domain S-box-containing protein [Planomicrobium koreense]|uniref:Diguanylate cyclase (GGDEF)-like protein/PAS domain S-box-containing protein n=1 Tax=Planococcus koreensis TaxID=112331 RepID=A0A7W8CNC0_9BACL|nr:diguanylate cyclase [Planococcus koreensis]MBB5178602.1 diguanylate cyclase (GGDEF)-like protein/PAS domain S-box-containing protein [Planococcus koreensis]
MRGPFTKKQLELLYGKTDSLIYFMRQTGDTYEYEYVNAAVRKVFRKDLSGLSLDEVMPPHLAEDIKNQYRIAMQQDAVHTYRDYNLFSKENATNETTITPMEHEGDVFVLAVSKNVAKQKKVEEEYLFYQSLVRNSVDPMLMITSEFIIFDMNLAYSKTFGVENRDWVGKPYGELPFVDDDTYNYVLSELNSYKTHRDAKPLFIKRKKHDGEEVLYSANYSPIMEGGEIRAFHIVLRELTTEYQLKHELRKTEKILESYKNALNYAALVAIWESSGIIKFINDNFKGTTGYEREEMLGMHISKIGKAVISSDQYNDIRKVVLSGSIWRGELKSLKKTGESFWIDTTIIPLSGEKGNTGQMLAIMFDITDRKKLEEQLHFMAYHDSLTKLPNRLAIVRKFAEMKAEADLNNEQLAIIYMDGDDFKSVNDQNGHEVGDEFIYRFGQAIQSSIRKQDMAARIGGDEFLIALSGLDPLHAEKQTQHIIGQIKASLERGWKIGDVHFSPTATLGVSLYPSQGKTMDELVNKADHSLYIAKRQGKNSVLFYTEEHMRNPEPRT